MSRVPLILAALVAVACAPDTLPEFAAARTAALATPPPVQQGWKPDAALVISAPLIDRLLTATLPVYGRIDQDLAVEGGVRVRPDLQIRRARVRGSASCEDCLAVDLRVDGTVQTTGPLRVEIPLDMTVGLDLAVQGTTVDGAHVVTITPKDVRQVSLKSARLPAGLRAALEDPLTAAVRKRVVEGATPIEAARFPAEGLPVVAIRAKGSRNGIRVDLRTAASTPTPLTLNTDKIRDGWTFAVQQDSLTDLARAEAMRQGAVYYDVVPEPTGLRVARGTFELDLRLWKTTGRGWWRDYTVHGTLTRTGDAFEMAPERVVEGPTSPGAASADLLAELGRSQIIDNIEAGIAGSLAASHAAELTGGLEAQVTVASVFGVGETVRVAGDVTLRTPSGNRSGE